MPDRNANPPTATAGAETDLRRSPSAAPGAETTVSTGRCACGGVRYRVRGPLRPVMNCHCEPCRRITGHFMAATAAADDDLDITETTLTWFRRTPEVSYGFCATCGSTLFWRRADRPTVTSITAGTLDQPSGLTTTGALFVDEAADYHRLDMLIPGSAGVEGRAAEIQ